LAFEFASNNLECSQPTSIYQLNDILGGNGDDQSVKVLDYEPKPKTSGDELDAPLISTIRLILKILE
jgi:hypothetical protein